MYQFCEMEIKGIIISVSHDRTRAVVKEEEEVGD